MSQQFPFRVKRSKYGAKPEVVDGMRFASQREARRYRELKLLQQAGEIDALECQVPYPMAVTNLQTGEVIPVGKYIADFRYWLRKKRPAEKSELVVEDSKGFRTPTYRLKKRLVEAQYGITITEV